MLKYSRTLLALVGATVAMGALVATASANRLALNSTSIRATWTSMTFTALEITVRCRVTLEGTQHSATITKSAGALIGYITGATVDEANCTGGRARANTETLPWHVTYESFTGTLPNIEAISTRVAGGTFEINTPLTLGNCRYEGSNTGRYNREARGVLTTVEVIGTARHVGGTGTFCPEPGRLSGNGRPTTSAGASLVSTLV